MFEKLIALISVLCHGGDSVQQVEEFDNYMLCNDSCFERFDDQTQADFNETAFISFIFCSM